MLIPYAAPAEPFHKETEIKKSIFIAHLVPVNSEEEAQKTLEGFRKQYKDATHNCYAWRTISSGRKLSSGFRALQSSCTCSAQHAPIMARSTSSHPW